MKQFKGKTSTIRNRCLLKVEHLLRLKLFRWSELGELDIISLRFFLYLYLHLCLLLIWLLLMLICLFNKGKFSGKPISGKVNLSNLLATLFIGFPWIWISKKNFFSLFNNLLIDFTFACSWMNWTPPQVQLQVNIFTQ